MTWLENHLKIVALEMHLLLNGWNAPLSFVSFPESKLSTFDNASLKRGKGGNHRGLTVFLLVFREGAQESVFLKIVFQFVKSDGLGLFTWPHHWRVVFDGFLNRFFCNLTFVSKMCVFS